MGKSYWFTESPILGAKNESRIQIKVKRKVLSFNTPLQKGQILDTFEYGRILVLDGIVQLSERDEFIYHEMITHLPLFSHSNPKRVLIVGGGDGGVLREALKHPIKNAVLVEIDKKVIDISKKYLPFVTGGAFKDKRTEIFIEDGVNFVKNQPSSSFDVVIIDSTDPGGPSMPIFSEKFYCEISRVLTEQGIMIMQSGTFWGQFFQIKKIFKDLKKVFPFVKIYRAGIPSFQEAEHSFTMVSKINLEKPDFKKIKKRYKKLNLKAKYYSLDIHWASGIMPKIYQINS